MVKLTLLLLSILQLTAAFAPATFGVRNRHVLFAGQKDEDSGGGAALAKPAVKIAQKTEVKAKEKVKSTTKAFTHDPISRRDEEFQDAPMFKLMLLGDDSYDVSHVIERMCAIMEDMDEDQAATVFKAAKQSGKAMCGKYPFERAELFKEQLIRSTPMIFSDLEEENK
jgi:ATP-dependent Clp protease adapter protein ClpS